jgi:hypothetical protein
MKRRKRNLLIQTAVLLLLVGGAIAAFIRAETKPLSRDELKIEAANLRSLASEGRQLSEQFLAGQMTETFFQTQTSLLQDKAQSEREKLDSSDIESGFELKHWQARHLAKQVEGVFSRLRDKSQNASQTKDELANLFSQLKELEDSLKQ